MKIDKNSLNELAGILREACHAKDCDRIFNCPNFCGCRTRRPFKLNTETAMCWEIADKLRMLVREQRPLKSDIEKVIISAESYTDISRFHMSRGWQKFFLEVSRCISDLTIDSDRYLSTHRLPGLRNTVKRLKREPR
jgi:hypothetical protein